LQLNIQAFYRNQAVSGADDAKVMGAADKDRLDSKLSKSVREKGIFLEEEVQNAKEILPFNQPCFDISADTPKSLPRDPFEQRRL